MTTDAQAYLKALHPPTLYEHLSDEDVSAQLDKSDKHRKSARKAQETLRQKRAEQATAGEKAGTN